MGRPLRMTACSQGACASVSLIPPPPADSAPLHSGMSASTSSAAPARALRRGSADGTPPTTLSIAFAHAAVASALAASCSARFWLLVPRAFAPPRALRGAGRRPRPSRRPAAPDPLLGVGLVHVGLEIVDLLLAFVQRLAGRCEPTRTGLAATRPRSPCDRPRWSGSCGGRAAAGVLVLAAASRLLCRCPAGAASRSSCQVGRRARSCPTAGAGPISEARSRWRRRRSSSYPRSALREPVIGCDGLGVLAGRRIGGHRCCCDRRLRPAAFCFISESMGLDLRDVGLEMFLLVRLPLAPRLPFFVPMSETATTTKLAGASSSGSARVPRGRGGSSPPRRDRPRRAPGSRPRPRAPVSRPPPTAAKGNSADDKPGRQPHAAAEHASDPRRSPRPSRRSLSCPCRVRSMTAAL